MAYSRLNFLHKIAEIQHIVLASNKKGVSQEWVYQNVIFPTYRISRATFYVYLGCNARAQIKRIEEAKKSKQGAVDK